MSSIFKRHVTRNYAMSGKLYTGLTFEQLKFVERNRGTYRIIVGLCLPRDVIWNR